ncbi:MAG: BON domain-containing protein [Gemmatimonadaceae bacterium]|nr:BON domain-containing protein [Gemmatimonadaceae bacterium]
MPDRSGAPAPDDFDAARGAAPATTQNAPARAQGWEHANNPSFPTAGGAAPADAGIVDERDLQRASRESLLDGTGDTTYAQDGAAEARRDATAAPADARLLDEIHRRLVGHRWLDSHDVEIAVHDGVVSITGRIATRTMRRELEDTCHAIPGVRDVMMHVRLDDAVA